jgi:hypothetical protein
MTYQRIQPFPAPGAFACPELRALSSVWKEQRATLEESGAYKAFIGKLQREWAVETGIIERLYTWDRAVTEGLIEQGSKPRLSRIVAVFLNRMPPTFRHSSTIIWELSMVCSDMLGAKNPSRSILSEDCKRNLLPIKTIRKPSLNLGGTFA